MNQDIEVDSASNVSDEDQELQDLTAQLKQAKDHQQMLQQVNGWPSFWLKICSFKRLFIYL